MAPSARVKAAFKAMKAIGIPEAKTKPALKKLLIVFDKNWDLIEAESYRVLADAIFEYEESEAAEKEKKKKPENAEQGEAPEPVAWQNGSMQDEPMQDEPERPLKRLRLKNQAQESPTSGVGPLKIPKPEPGGSDTSPNQSTQCRTKRAASQNVLPQPLVRNKGKQPNSSSGSVPSSATTPSASPRGKQKRPQMIALIKPKDEPFTDDAVSIEPLAVVLPENTNGKASIEPAKDNQSSGTVDGIGKGMKSKTSTDEKKHLQEADVSNKTPTKINIAASSLGKVQISLTSNAESVGYEVSAPDLESIMKKVNDDCLKTYKITDPEFSVTKLMKQFCDCVEELGEKVHGTSKELSGQVVHTNDNNGVCVTPRDSSLNRESSQDVADTNDGKLLQNSSQIASEDNSVERDTISKMNKSIVIAHHCDTSDITMGRETVIVSLEEFKCEFLPTFRYISQNVILDSADLKISLAQIGDQGCCLSCHADCLSASCNCSQRNGGEFPYTADSLIREEFLDECVSIVRNPQKHDLTYCKECPLERLKNEGMLDPCKGHLKRKFIKECNTKCGCSQYCGNRVVQRGLKYNFQVFWTPEGKGWGLRASDNIPRGAFVCEFVGEILTTSELHKRNMSGSNDKHSYSLLLDTDWGTRVLKGEQFLCLDATFYGNVGRFVNHRCTDANLIEIPVEVESPSHHYYHVALFTTRNVDAFEELTWDYGVDFDDTELHIKAFRCLCGSRFCRNMKRSSRSRSALTLQ